MFNYIELTVIFNPHFSVNNFLYLKLRPTKSDIERFEQFGTGDSAIIHLRKDINMKSVKSFFLLVGVLTVVLIVFFFRINSDGVFVGGSGGGRHGHSHNSVKVVNMNVFSDALREVLKKSPDSIEKILTKVSELTQGNRPDSATSVEIQNGSGSKSDKYVILNEDNKNENKNGGDIKNHVDDGGVKETANKHEKLNKEAEKGKVAVDNSDNNKQKQQLVDANASEDGKAVIAKKESKEDASSPDTNKKPLCSEQGSKLGN